MEPLTPGMTMVAEAITPTRKRIITLRKLKLKSTALPSLSPISPITTTRAKKAIREIICPTFIFCPFTFLVIMGSPPRIRPIKKRFVGTGNFLNRNSIPKEPATSATAAPSRMGIKNLTLFLNSLNKWVRQKISLS